MSHARYVNPYVNDCVTATIPNYYVKVKVGENFGYRKVSCWTTHAISVIFIVGLTDSI